MNKRVRKKHYKRGTLRAYKDLALLFSDRRSEWDERWNYLHHPRRRWLSPARWRDMQVQYNLDIQTEKEVIREMWKTHNYTLAGWIP